MHPADIKAALAKTGTSMTALALTLPMTNGKPVTMGAISNVIYGRSKSYRIARAIAQLLGASVSDLWPHIYGKAAVKPHFKLHVDGRRVHVRDGARA